MSQREQGENLPSDISGIPVGDPKPQNPARLSYLERTQADYARLQRFLTATEEDERKQLVNPDEYIPGVIEITMALYPKSPEIHAILLPYLYEHGYEVEDLTTPEAIEKSISGRPEPEVMRANGWSTGFAKLREDAMQRVGKCGSCSEYISVRGIQSHDHQCEKCGEVTYKDMVKGSQVSLGWFREPESAVSFKVMANGELVTSPMDGRLLLGGGSLVVERYDHESGLIYCYGDIAEVEKEGIDVGSNARELYRKLADAGHSDRIMISRNDISDVWGHVWNHKIVKLYQGKEYGEWDHLPVSETYSIYEPWHWVPAEPSPTLHEKIISAAGMVSDKGYYYQDGRAAFYDVHLDRMRRFVDHFTTLNLNRWDVAIIWAADKSGPGMIDAIAHFCHEAPIIEDRPNIGNALIGLADSLAGKPKTRAQIEAEIRYMRTEGFDGSIDDLVEAMRKAGLIPTEDDVRKAKEQRNWIQSIWDSLNK